MDNETFQERADHELAGVIAAILALVTPLKDGSASTDVERTHFIDRLHVQAQRAAALVQDLGLLRSLAQGRAPKLHAAGPIDLAALLRERWRAGRDRAGLRPLAWRVEICSAPRPVAGNARLWTRALDHLIDNALRYTADGGWISITLRALDEGSLLEVGNSTTIDTSEPLESLFEPFARVNKAASRLAGGNGLGLTVVKRVAEHCGGQVRLRSDADAGTTVTVVLPAPPTL